MLKKCQRVKIHQNKDGGYPLPSKEGKRFKVGQHAGFRDTKLFCGFVRHDSFLYVNTKDSREKVKHFLLTYFKKLDVWPTFFYKLLLVKFFLKAMFRV